MIRSTGARIHDALAARGLPVISVVETAPGDFVAHLGEDATEAQRAEAETFCKCPPPATAQERAASCASDAHGCPACYLVAMLGANAPKDAQDASAKCVASVLAAWTNP